MKEGLFMKRMQDDDFLKPLKNRPGLKARQEFKRDLETKLQGLEVQKRRYQFLKVPLLLGLAFLLIFAIFSENILEQFNSRTGENKSQFSHDENKDDLIDQHSKADDIIKWNGSLYINNHDGSEIISGELIGMKLGAINKKVAINKEALLDGEATKIEEGTMVYYVANTENIAIKRNDEWIMYQLVGNKIETLSENEAMKIAKRFAPNEQISWNTELIKEPSILDIPELKANSNPIWRVIGTYPMGNIDLFYIDSITGVVLSTGDMEKEGFGEYADDFIELKELKDHLDKTTYVYSGEIKLLLSEKAKIELKNGTSILVSLSGEESSTQLDPIQIVNPKDKISVPFEIDLDSEERIHKMLGNLKLFIELKDEQNVIIYKKEIKAFSVE